jgi:hypothetical protein
MSGQAERGARWLGAVEGMRRRLGRIALAEDRDVGWVVTAALEKLGDEAFERAFAAGFRDTWEEALADARALAAELSR